MSRAPSVTSMRSSALLGLLLTTVLTTPLVAQDQAGQPVAHDHARLQGVVILDSTFEPIAGATVSVMDTDIATLTGPFGDFALPDAPLGTVWVRVMAPGLPSIRERVEVSEEGIVFLQFRMPDDVFAVLDELAVDVFAPDVSGSLSEAESALDLLAIKVPSIRMYQAGSVGQTDAQVQLRGFSSLTQDGQPLLVVDDVVVTGDSPLNVLRQMPASDVATIEVLRGPTAAFRYPYASNGVIRVKTKHR